MSSVGLSVRRTGPEEPETPEAVIFRGLIRRRDSITGLPGRVERPTGCLWILARPVGVYLNLTVC